MQPALERAARARLGPYEIDPRAGELTRDGRRVRLPPKPFEVLLALLESGGEVVLRETLYERLWPGKAYLDFDNNLNSAVATLREALGDAADAPRFIETLPKRGYRLLVPVEWTAADRGEDRPEPAPSRNEGGPADARPSPTHAAPHGRARLPHSGVTFAIALLAIFLAATIALRWRGGIESPARLAILPFEDISHAGREPYFAAGLTEDLIARVGGRLPAERLEVLAPASMARYAGEPPSPWRAARELRTDYLLQGTVRREGGAVRVTTRLVRAGDGATMWSARFDERLDRVLVLQDEIAARIARALELRLAPGDAPVVPAAAYEALLRGRHLLRDRRPEAARQAVGELERAVRIAPRLAPAWVSLSTAWSAVPAPPRTTAPHSRAALRRALALEPLSAEAQLRRAQLAIYFDYDWSEGERALAEALRLAPGSSAVHQARAAFFSLRGRHDEARRAMDRARSLDPVAATVAADAGWYEYVARNYRATLERSAEALELEPGHQGALFYRHLAHRALGDPRAALRAAADYQRAHGAADSAAATLAAGDVEAGLRAFHLWQLGRHRETAGAQYQSPAVLALDHLALGDAESALGALERAYADRAGWLLPFLDVYPPLDPLRSEPRFRSLSERLAIPGRSAG